MRRLLFAIALAVPALLAGCGDDGLPAPFDAEASRMAAVAPPDGWGPLDSLRVDLDDDQTFREVDGVRMLLAGDFGSGPGRPTGIGVAWESPTIDEADTADLCAQVAEYARRAAVADVMGADEVTACIAAPTDPDLRRGFVVPFSSSVVAAAGGSRSFSGGVLLADDGRIRYVVSLAYVVDP